MKACAGLLPTLSPLLPGAPAVPGMQLMASEIRGQSLGAATGQPAAPSAGASARASAGPSPALDRLGQQFARALDEQAGAEEALPPRETDVPAGPLPWPPAPPALHTAPAPAPPSAASHAPATAVAAAAKAQETAPAAPTTVAQVEQGQVWELSLNEPDGVVLSLRAERLATPVSPSSPSSSCSSPAGATPAAWSLVVNAPAAEAAALQRHAPRLAERLAARALAPAHVRIASRHDPHGD